MDEPEVPHPDRERVRSRADSLAAEGGEEIPDAQAEARAEAMLAESDLRTEDREAAPSAVYERRTSEETVDPSSG